MDYLEIEPARAKHASDKKLLGIWGAPDWIAEEKLDGWRYLLHFGRQLDRSYLTGRRVSAKTGLFSEKGEQVPHIWPIYDGDYTVLDGEIYPPDGASFRDIAGIMNADAAVARERVRKIGSPTYRVFDALYLDGVDLRELSLIERRKILANLVPLLDQPLIQLVPQMEPHARHFDEIVARGGEGLILKDLGAPYGEGWIKVKREHTLDVIVTGFTEARFGRTGKYVGLIGAAVVSVYSSSGDLLEVGQVSGMDDATRRDMSERRGEWIGTVVEISAQEWAKDRLRHPRFVRARPEADIRSCTYAKMMRELGESEERCEDERQLPLL